MSKRLEVTCPFCREVLRTYGGQGYSDEWERDKTLNEHIADYHD